MSNKENLTYIEQTADLYDVYIGATAAGIDKDAGCNCKNGTVNTGKIIYHGVPSSAPPLLC